MSKIIMYFSRSGNNYVNGKIQNLSVGNTEIAANIIHKLTDASVFKIEPVVAYSNDYSECIEEAKKDLQQQARPELTAYPDSIAAYDTIYLGYPNYWGTMPMAVFTLLEHFDFSGKTILPFCTHEGSGMGKSEADLKKVCPNAIIRKGLAIHGAFVNQSEEKIIEWIGRESK